MAWSAGGRAAAAASRRSTPAHNAGGRRPPKRPPGLRGGCRPRSPGGAPGRGGGWRGRLARADATEPGAGTGRDVYLNRANPFFPAPARVAAGYAAARRLAPRVDAARGGCYVAKQQTDRVLLTHCRTGRDYRFRVSVGRGEGTGLSVDVAGPGGAAIAQLGLSDLPQRYPFPIIAARRAELVR